MRNEECVGGIIAIVVVVRCPLRWPHCLTDLRCALQALDSAQMTASAGQLIDLQGGKHKAFIAWARPPIYFCQLLPDAATGALPTVRHRRATPRARARCRSEHAAGEIAKQRRVCVCVRGLGKFAMKL